MYTYKILYFLKREFILSLILVGVLLLDQLRGQNLIGEFQKSRSHLTGFSIFNSGTFPSPVTRKRSRIYWVSLKDPKRWNLLPALKERLGLRYTASRVRG